jgi:hypothetical protein
VKHTLHFPPFSAQCLHALQSLHAVQVSAYGWHSRTGGRWLAITSPANKRAMSAAGFMRAS